MPSPGTLSSVSVPFTRPRFESPASTGLVPISISSPMQPIMSSISISRNSSTVYFNIRDNICLSASRYFTFVSYAEFVSFVASTVCDKFVAIIFPPCFIISNIDHKINDMNIYFRCLDNLPNNAHHFRTDPLSSRLPSSGRFLSTFSPPCDCVLPASSLLTVCSPVPDTKDSNSHTASC